MTARAVLAVVGDEEGFDGGAKGYWESIGCFVLRARTGFLVIVSAGMVASWWTPCEERADSCNFRIRRLSCTSTIKTGYTVLVLLGK